MRRVCVLHSAWLCSWGGKHVSTWHSGPSVVGLAHATAFSMAVRFFFFLSRSVEIGVFSYWVQVQSEFCSWSEKSEWSTVVS